MSSNKTVFSIGLMHELALVLQKKGWNSDHVSTLIQYPFLVEKLLKVFEGTHDILPCFYKITSSEPPKTKGYEIFSHKPMKGKFLVPDKIDFLKIQGSSDSDILERIKDYELLNANARDYFLANTANIPSSKKWLNEDGQPRVIYFWGTIYQDANGKKYVSCLLDSTNNGWEIHYRPIDDLRGRYEVAVIS